LFSFVFFGFKFLEWLYVCIIKKYFIKMLAIMLMIATVMVIWSEMTFFNKKPVLSILAVISNGLRENYKYLIIEVIDQYSYL
jgi:hypothetical protein